MTPAAEVVDVAEKDKGAATLVQVAPEGDEPSKGAAKGDDPSSPKGAAKCKKGKKNKEAAAAYKPFFPKFWQYQPQALAFYTNIKIQMFVAGLISGNFVLNIIEKWIDPKGTEYALVWKVFETFWNVMFTLELGLNMYASWLCAFWKSSWNVFDFVVVAIGLLTTLEVPLPGPFSMLRMMRAFRVFRLFKRIKSLNKIMVSLAKALPGVGNAFIILLLVMSIYAIIAVDLFREYGKDGHYINIKGDQVTIETTRGQKYGYEYFDNFGKSLYTMFQVLTGDSWSEVIARPLLMCNSVVDAFGVAFFFVSFVIVNGVVLINVVVAVLLEKMVDDPNEGKEEEDEGADGEESEEEEEAGGKKAIEEKDGRNGQKDEKAQTNGDEKEIKENANKKLVGDSSEKLTSVESERVVSLMADLEGMKLDMANIQSNLAHILNLMEIKIDDSEVPPASPQATKIPLSESGPRDIGLAKDEENKAPTVSLPGTLEIEIDG